MRTIGLDLGVAAAHKAVVADAQGQFVTPLLTVWTHPAELAQLLTRAREGAADAALQVVMEPTSMAWFPVAAYLVQHAVAVYLVNGQDVAALRRYYQRHAKSDRIDARVLARLPLVNPEKLHPLHLPAAAALACQRACRELDRLTRAISAVRNRLQAIDRFAWPGLEEAVFPDADGPLRRWFREHWYDPQQVLAAGAPALAAAWRTQLGKPAADGAWADALVACAQQVLDLYGATSPYLDYGHLQAELQREQTTLAGLEARQQQVREQVVRPLYHQIHPSRQLESLRGVGQDSAAVYASFIGDAQRFATTRQFRGWTGMVPASDQSATTEAQGLHITQAGPELIKKYAYLDAEIGRRFDPQLAAIYYEQMVKRGKHHQQAVCACATHLLDRVLVVLREGKAYELRDVDGTVVTKQQARAIIAARYTVPAAVRQQRSVGRRRARAEQAAERHAAKEGAPRAA